MPVISFPLISGVKYYLANGEAWSPVVKHRYGNPVGILIYYISFLTLLNNGKHYPNASYTYPIRKKKKTTTKLSQENLNKICELIQNTNISFAQIARDFNLSSSTVGRINSGKYHFDENKSYPLRKK